MPHHGIVRRGGSTGEGKTGEGGCQAAWGGSITFGSGGDSVSVKAGGV